MGIFLGKFVKTENETSSTVKVQIRPQFIECKNNTKKVTGSERKVPVHMKAVYQTLSSSSKEGNLKSIGNMNSNGILIGSSSSQNYPATLHSLQWNFEDEYKSYVQKSMKRKFGSNNVSHQRKLRKICQEQSSSHHSIACEISIDKLQTSPNTSKRDISGNLNKLLMNVKVILDKLPDIAPNSCIKIDHNKSLCIQNTKIKTRTHTRSSLNNGKKIENLSSIQLISEPRVVLDQTIVFNYLKAKRIIDKILRPDNKKLL